MFVCSPSRSQAQCVMGRPVPDAPVRRVRAALTAAFAAALFAQTAAHAQFVVTSTADAGPGSLRQALIDAAAGAGGTISFNIPTTDPGFNLPGSAGAWRIAVSTPLPALTRTTSINGLTQPGASCVSPRIELRAAGSTATIGITVAANNSEIRGLVINGFESRGVWLQQVTGCTVACNFIGTSVTGQSALGNGVGIVISGGSNNTIGGAVAAAANLIAGNIGSGVEVVTSGPVSNVGNSILRNSIRANGALGIDLAANGVTANDDLDLDIGPNHLQNHPVITGYDGSTITATLGSLPNRRFRVEFFANAAQDPSGFGEGDSFIDAVEVQSNSGGQASMSVPYVLAPGVRYITATATALPPLRDSSPDPGVEGIGPRGIAPAAPTGTSEFSPTFRVGPPDGNQPPVARDDAYTTNEDTPLVVGIAANGVLANDSDPENMTLTAALVSSPTRGTVMLADDGTFTYVPSANFNGSDAFTYRASDGELSSALATVHVTVNPVNDAPFAVADEYTTAEDTPLVVQPRALGVLGNDIDADGDVLMAVEATVPANGTLSFSPDGTFTYTPAPDFFGQDTFTYRASDGLARSGPAMVTIDVTPVNDPPVARDDAYTTAFATPLIVGSGAAGLLSNDSDPENDPLSAVQASAPASGGSVTLNGDGTFTYTPGAGFSGVDSFTYRARDGLADSQPATVRITVRGNTPPTAVDDTYATSEDTPLTVSAASMGVLANDSDPEAPPQVLTAMLVTTTTRGTLTFNPNGTFSYNPGPNLNGPDTFTYRASDGVATSGIATVTINVAPVNDPPVARNDSYFTPEDVPLDVPPPGVLANDSDVDDAVSSLIVTITTQPDNGVLSNLASGGFRYTPNLNFNGTDTFRYRLTDPAGAQSGIAVVSITVQPQNDPPVAVDDQYQTDEDTPLTVAAPGVLANDSDPDGPTSLTAQLISPPVPAAGFALNPDGSFTFTPVPDFFGTVSFTYRASDGSLSSAPATVRIEVRPLDDPPVALNDLYETDEDTPLAIAAPGVLDNDFDPDGPASLTAQLVSPPAPAAAFALNPDGSFSFTPVPDFFGTVTFMYRASDGASGSAPATVTIVVRPVNDPPIARDDAYETPRNTPLVVNAALGVLTNDSDVDSGTLTAAGASAPSNGQLTLNDDGSFTYIPSTDFVGNDSFSYRASDGLLASSPATVRISVRGAGGNQPPVARCRDVTIDARSTCPPPEAFFITPADVDNGSSDPDHPTESLVFSVSNTGPFRLGSTRVTLTVTDPKGASSICTATVTVLGDDCNRNGIPDTCDIAGGAADCNRDGVPDECQCLWDNGMAAAGGSDGGRLSQIGGRIQVASRVADDFYLEPGSVYRITSFSGQVLTSLASGLRNARLEFLEDCNGVPQSRPIATFTSAVVSAEEPAAGGQTLVTYSFNLCAANLWLDGGRVYWVSLTSTVPCGSSAESRWAYASSEVLCSLPRVGLGRPSPYLCTQVNFDPWLPADTALGVPGGCRNMAFKIGGAPCPIIWDNGDYEHCPGGGGLASGRSGRLEVRSADNFVVKPCDDQTVCFIETWVWTNGNPATGFVEIYSNECKSPGTRLFSAPVSRFVDLGETIRIGRVDVHAYLLRFYDPGWRLERGRTYWLSSGVTNVGGSINAVSYFARADRCATRCDVRISPAWMGNVGAGGVMWCPKAEDLAFRIAATPGVRTKRPGASSGPDAPCPTDITGDGVASVDDLLGFIDAWFAGCP